MDLATLVFLFPARHDFPGILVPLSPVGNPNLNRQSLETARPADRSYIENSSISFLASSIWPIRPRIATYDNQQNARIATVIAIFQARCSFG